MSEWIAFLHAPREHFAETMTPDEQAVFGAHAARLERLLDEGPLILAGPTLGAVNTGIVVFEAPDEAAAQRILDEDPVIVAGLCSGELRPFRATFLRGR
ncbi:YciI family protein [Solirubrobacter ginsenosidimutans]|uniref:YciI family protein n=1 Tax=Solirubrobacter ginsenosidimutans TaxID=490573 RepID=A0A9X3N1G8_9ACTN|nr:YciI family protein [Solirubrobacter ginsenosidimutans]MDA0166896.1 YciI family protein [Solirubrobacter ginsenosidimutans]